MVVLTSKDNGFLVKWVHVNDIIYKWCQFFIFNRIDMQAGGFNLKKSKTVKRMSIKSVQIIQDEKFFLKKSYNLSIFFENCCIFVASQAPDVI